MKSSAAPRGSELANWLIKLGNSPEKAAFRSLNYLICSRKQTFKISRGKKHCKKLVVLEVHFADEKCHSKVLKFSFFTIFSCKILSA